MIDSNLSLAPASDDNDDEPYLAGLSASYSDKAGTTATRIDHQLSFQWSQAAADPRLAPGDFQAAWKGFVLVGRGDYRFALFGTGEVELKVGNQVVLARQRLQNEWRQSQPITLDADHQPLVLSFRRTGQEARLQVLWSGPQFGWEPILPRFLFHQRKGSPGYEFERGQLLARALRCGHCHGGEMSPAAPALDGLPGRMTRSWLVQWLLDSENRPPAETAPRRMPVWGLSKLQAEAVADCLLAANGQRPTPDQKPEAQPKPQSQQPKTGNRKPKVASPKPTAAMGERLFLTLGCLACHTWHDVGAGGWFGGGDLSQIADKRPAGFFADWLADPGRLNRDHRMPVFELSTDERTALSLFLSEQKSNKAAPPPGREAERRSEGKKLVAQLGCGACHRLPETAGPSAIDNPQAAIVAAPRLDGKNNWKSSCSHEPEPGKRRPGYRLNPKDARALQVYYTTRKPDQNPGRQDGRMLLAEKNCLACHAREGERQALPLSPPLLADHLLKVAKRYPELAPQIPALTPPALNSVGDKLTDAALAEVIARRGPAHRNYLQVRMPRFPLAETDLQALTSHLIVADRLPPRPAQASPVDKTQLSRFTIAGGRLVSGDGFGCTSCHQVGSVLPAQGPLNARGPNLSLLERRIRRDWFDRWLRNPARIIPLMEMPSVQVPVTGVLGDRLDDQVNAVWHVLNQPGFEPPAPNPLRILRHDGQHPQAQPGLVTDILHHASKVWLKPFLVGLANRHTVLLDLATGGVTMWLIGDIARQRTKGKSWFWELAGAILLETGLAGPDLTLVVNGRDLLPRPAGQFVTEADSWQSDGAAQLVSYRLAFTPESMPGKAGQPVLVHVQRRFSPLAAEKGESGFAQELIASSVPVQANLRLRVLSADIAAKAALSPDGRSLRLSDRFASRIVLQKPANAKFSPDGTVLLLPLIAEKGQSPLPSGKGEGAQKVHLVLHYLADVPVDRFPTPPAPAATVRKVEPVEVAPGFVGERLALPAEIMPSAFTWRPNGRLVFASYRGQVFETLDSDHDGLEDKLMLLADGLPNPYGAHAGPGYVDVSAKYALLRIWDQEAQNAPSGKEGQGAGKSPLIQTIASGWGYTDDYHDWAIGLPKNRRGEYFIGIPCQQDKRLPAAARFHGSVLRLVPRKPTADHPHLFNLEPVSSGHRFPTGLALDRAGELFVTDNQGNYNPFNELNHVRPGVHFGFINTLDRGKPPPPLTEPAIDIPHPWTRSVNGICFLDSPKGMAASPFGPFEGHLIGCEYDTRRLIRMTLQRVGDTFQGAAYPLSILPDDPGRGFLGPIVCAVSPKGELYVGSVRDSGWGAGNNVGEIVRVRLILDKLPCGMAEVRATSGGFVVDFFKPIDPALGGRPDSYAIESYRRVSTPAYGGPDRERRTEKVSAVTVAADARRVTLQLAELRPGFVYEFRLKNLAPASAMFHPAEAHYTLRVVPR